MIYSNSVMYRSPVSIQTISQKGKQTICIIFYFSLRIHSNGPQLVGIYSESVSHPWFWWCYFVFQFDPFLAKGGRRGERTEFRYKALSNCRHVHWGQAVWDFVYTVMTVVTANLLLRWNSQSREESVCQELGDGPFNVVIGDVRSLDSVSEVRYQTLSPLGAGHTNEDKYKAVGTPGAQALLRGAYIPVIKDAALVRARGQAEGHSPVCPACCQAKFSSLSQFSLGEPIRFLKCVSAFEGLRRLD